MLLRTEDSLWCRKYPLVNVWQLAVIPVPVSTSKEPVLGAGVGVLPLLKPPENTSGDTSALSLSLYQTHMTAARPNMVLINVLQKKHGDFLWCLCL